MTSLVCPSCGDRYPASERFCASCRVPLVFAAEDSAEVPVSERHERARKVKPQLSEGDLVKVAGARHQAEAEFIQGLLLEEGVPSILRRTAGFDVPDFLAAGPRDADRVPAERSSDGPKTSRGSASRAKRHAGASAEAQRVQAESVRDHVNAIPHTSPCSCGSGDGTRA